MVASFEPALRPAERLHPTRLPTAVPDVDFEEAMDRTTEAMQLYERLIGDVARTHKLRPLDAGAVGRQADEEIRVEELARLAQTTEHDITTRLTSRVVRATVNRDPSPRSATCAADTITSSRKAPSR